MRRFYHPAGMGISSIWVKVRAVPLRYEACWRPAHERRTPLQTKDLHDSRSPNATGGRPKSHEVSGRRRRCGKARGDHIERPGVVGEGLESRKFRLLRTSRQDCHDPAGDGCDGYEDAQAALSERARLRNDRAGRKRSRTIVETFL